MKISMLAVAFAFLFLSEAVAQENVNLEKGLNPYGSYQGGNLDSVSMTSGGLMLHAPLISYPQRGGKLSLGFFIRYNSKGWRIHRLGTYQGAGGLWTTDMKGVEVVPDQEISTRMQAILYKYWENDPNEPGIWVFIYRASTSDGAEHFVGSRTNYSSPNDTLHPSLDGTGIMPIGLSGDFGAVIDRSGIRHSTSSVNNQTVVHREDPNGNKITLSASGWTDTLGRVIPNPAVTTDYSSCSSGTVEAKLWNFPGPNGGTSPIKLCYANFNISTSFGYWDNGAIQEWTGTMKFLREIVLPNGTKWTFNYNNYGDLIFVGFPTGGTISYTWTTKQACYSPHAPLSRFVASRQVNANDGTGTKTWTYNWITQLDPVPHIPQSIVTDPSGNDTRYFLTGVGPCSSVEAKREYFQGSASTGTLLKTVETSGQSLQNPYYGYYEIGSNAFLPTAVTTKWPNGKVSKVETTYDPGTNHPFYFYGQYNSSCRCYPPVASQVQVVRGSVTEQTEFDYASGSPGPILRKTLTDYLWQSNTDYLTSNLLDIPALVRIQGLNQSGVLEDMAKTQYGYDAGTPISSGITTQLNTNIAAPRKRGNTTSVGRWLKSNNTFLTSTTTYFDTGMPQQTTDPGGHTTTFTYSANFAGAYVTQTQLPNTNSPNFAQHIVSGNYDFNTGLLTSFTDQTNQTTSYTYDTMRRITSATFPAQTGGTGVTSFFYPTATTLQRQQKIDASRWTDLHIRFDGLGREIRRITANDEATPWDQVDTCYDARGLVAFKSHPYQGSGLWSPLVCSGAGAAFTYDGLSRVTQVTSSDGTTVLSDYAAQATRVRDEGNGSVRVERISQTDALGRLRSVCEVTSATLIGITGAPAACGQDIAATGFLTTYDYDALGNLKLIVQGGLNQRTFEYDSLSRLLSATTLNPARSTTNTMPIGT